MHTLGLGIPSQTITATNTYQRILNIFEPPWWYNWNYDQLHMTGYTPMLWRPNIDSHAYEEAVSLAQSNRSKCWLLGNEPERSEQSHTDPATFAQAVHHWTQETDVRFALPGIMFSDATADTWLLDYIKARGPVPTYWHIHIYAHTAKHWINQWEQWKDYLNTNDLPLLPTIISECAAWHPDPGAQKQVMNAVIRTASYDPLLQTAAWFSASYGPAVAYWSRSDLITGGTVSQLGQHYLSGHIHHDAQYDTYLPAIAHQRIPT